MKNPTHTRLAKVARRLIAKNGRLVQLLQVVHASVPVDSDTNPFAGISSDLVQEPSVTVLAEITAVQSDFTASEIDGVQVQANDKRFLLDSQVAPTNAMRLRDEGLDYSIINVIEVKPGDVSCLYKVQVRV